jgi:tripartite motif-containing protein 71
MTRIQLTIILSYRYYHTQILSKLVFSLFLSLVFSIVALMMSSTAFSQQTNETRYSFAFKWGSNGSGDGQFLRPHDVDFDSKGNVYVSDRDRNDIQKFSPNRTFILKWGHKGIHDGEFRTPYSISIDKDDNVYVVDRDNNRIEKFDNNGTFLRKWDKFDAKGSNDTMLRPEDMAIDPVSRNVYITDTLNNRTIKLDDKFNFILDWGSHGTGEGEFDHPHGIGVDSSGNVYVNELTNARIQKFDSDGNFIKQWGSEGTSPGQFSLGLEHLFVDPQSNVWQVDGRKNPRIQEFDSNGNYLTQVGSGPCIIPDNIKNDPERMVSYDKCDGKLHEPEHANINSKGDLYVVDRGNQRVVVYSPIKEGPK